MAIRPCTICTRRYVGPASSYYFGLLQGGSASRWKLRLCPACGHELDQSIAGRTIDVSQEQDDQEQQPSTCAACTEPASPADAALFITTYRVGEDRADYFSQVHLNTVCVKNLMALFSFN